MKLVKQIGFGVVVLAVWGMTGCLSGETMPGSGPSTPPSTPQGPAVPSVSGQPISPTTPGTVPPPETPSIPNPQLQQIRTLWSGQQSVRAHLYSEMGLATGRIGDYKIQQIRLEDLKRFKVNAHSKSVTSNSGVRGAVTGNSRNKIIPLLDQLDAAAKEFDLAFDSQNFEAAKSARDKYHNIGLNISNVLAAL